MPYMQNIEVLLLSLKNARELRVLEFESCSSWNEECGRVESLRVVRVGMKNVRE
jgi:hypothetical protein